MKWRTESLHIWKLLPIKLGFGEPRYCLGNPRFRADMDGLHINEATNLPFAFEIEGHMHGCGHDAHTAILLAAAEILNSRKEEINGTVRLLFQTGEETGTGAKQMLAEGALEGVDAICAIHVGNLAGDNVPTGLLVILPGPVSAGKDKFTITVHGKGTHSAFPEKGVDPILIAARIVNACEEISARELPVGTAAELGADKVLTSVPSALMGSDDFANYAEKIPGVYFFLCTNNIDKGIIHANHNPEFDVDEDVLREGVAAYSAVAMDFLK